MSATGAGPAVPEELLAAVDLGTTKVEVLVGLVREDGVTVVGTGSAPSHGLVKGAVVDIEASVEAISKALGDAAAQAGARPAVGFATISGNHIHNASSQATVAVANRDHGIGEDDFRRVVEQAQNISLPSDHQILHAIVQEFSVDAQDGIRNPVGMYGGKLEARVRIVTGAITCIQNVVRSLERSGLHCGGVILQALASERAVLTHEERELGAICLDIGGGTTDLAVIAGKTLRHTAVLTIGGHQISKDIAFGLRVPFAAAEELKRAAGSCLQAAVREEDVSTIPAAAGRAPRTVPVRMLARIIEPRIEEIFELVKEQLRSAGIAEEALGGGLVLTGGSARLPHLVEKAEQVFEQLSARTGETAPPEQGGLAGAPAGPEHAAAAGLLLLAAEQRRQHPVARPPAPGVAGALKWFRGLFKDS